jgi:hypothetical protein
MSALERLWTKIARFAEALDGIDDPTGDYGGLALAPATVARSTKSALANGDFGSVLLACRAAAARHFLSESFGETGGHFLCRLNVLV